MNGDEIDWDAWVLERHKIFEEKPSLNQYLGLHLEAAGPGWARMRVTLLDHHMNPFGAAHGGTVGAIIDSVCGSAIAAGLAPDDRIRGTIDMQVHFLERAAGPFLRAEGRMIRAGRSIAIAQADVFNEQDERVAMGTATFRLADPGAVRPRNED